MRKVLVTIVLALTAVSLALGQASDTKVIKDTNEYNAYMAALNTTDPAGQAAAMEAFLKQYPQTIMLNEAMDQILTDYQQANNAAKILDMSRRILTVNPNHMRALIFITALDRSVAMTGSADTPAALKEGCATAQTGLTQLPAWTKPNGMADGDFDKFRNQATDIFNGMAGFCALQAKDYVGARPYYIKAFQLDPTNWTDVYQLAVSYLEPTPIDLNGLWYAAKALQLTTAANNPAMVKTISDYAKYKYKKYHGTYDGWDAFVASVATQTAPPPAADLAKAITPAPTPCDLAVQVVKDNDPLTLPISDWEFVLSQANCSPANKAAADKVWASVQEKEKGGEAKLKITIKVIAATNDSIEGAITDENQAANKADVHVVMEAPIPPPARGSTKSNIPAVGSTTDIIGVFSSYTADPFMFTMTKGELPAAAKTPPVHHPPVRKKGR
jgi:tetratricopeptide (TPR) repeat protein